MVSNYTDFPNVYDVMKQKLDKSKLYEGKFETYQNQTSYQMTKYFFKYMQNYFQTYSPIFMKAWDTVSADFDSKCKDYNSTFRLINDLFIDDHELKFYILSVNMMAMNDTYKEVGLRREDVI